MSVHNTAPTRHRLLQRLDQPGEALLVAVLIAVLCLPVVTALAAAAAGSAQLRDLVEHERRPNPAVQLRLTWLALRSHTVVWAGPLAWVTVAAVDGVAVLGGLPGALWITPLLVAALSAGLLVGLGAATDWRPGREWPTLVAHSASRLASDGRGTLLMVLTVAVGVGLVVVLPAIVVLVPGILVAVAVGVARRNPV